MKATPIRSIRNSRSKRNCHTRALHAGSLPSLSHKSAVLRVWTVIIDVTYRRQINVAVGRARRSGAGGIGFVLAYERIFAT